MNARQRRVKRRALKRIAYEVVRPRGFNKPILSPEELLSLMGIPTKDKPLTKS